GHQFVDALRRKQLLGLWRTHDAGSNAVYSYAATRHFKRQGTACRVHTSLGRCVIGLTTVSEDAGYRRDADDASPAGRDHWEQKRLGDGVKAAERGIDHP